MRKKRSICLLIFVISITAALSLSAGFLAGTRKSWDAYEQRIDLLQKQNDMLISRQKQEESVKEHTAESLKVIEPYDYVLLAEDGFVAVYQADRETLYATTGILLESLPENLRREIEDGKIIESEEQLYNFLENYSS